ncbi:MAG TPA: copper transporter [Actinomycetota bacterium]|nr:copper transporter [Actinomycetota bacterium]
MISFRYHIFTIVAIFLAVGLGLLFGSSVVQPALIEDLENQANQLGQDLADTRAEVSDLNAQVEALQEAGDILPSLDRGTLTDRPVVLVTHDAVDPRLLSQARQSLSEAAVRMVAELSITDRMTVGDEPSREALAELLGMASDTETPTLQMRAAEVLAQRLAVGAPRRAVSPSGPDILDELLTANFLTTTPGSPSISQGDLAGIGGKDQLVIVLSGGLGEPLVDPQLFFVPLIEGLVQRGAIVAAGESVSTDYPFVPALRSDGAAGDGTEPPMVTVDDLDFSVGGAALVLGLERLVLLGQGGNYGIKAGATAPLPPLT